MDDPQYVLRLQSRTGALQRKSVETQEGIAQTRRAMARSRAGLEAEMQALRQELMLLQNDILASTEQIRWVVGRFKTVAKRSELERLQTRADAWAPEKRISRDAFRKLLG